MFKPTVVFWGAQEKSTIINRIFSNPACKEKKNINTYVSTDRIFTFNYLSIKNGEMLVRGLPNSSKHKHLLEKHFHGAQVGVYCVDLARDIDEKQILTDVKLFKEKTPGACVLLLGTNSADVKKGAATQFVTMFQGSKGIFKQCFVVPSGKNYYFNVDRKSGKGTKTSTGDLLTELIEWSCLVAPLIQKRQSSLQKAQTDLIKATPKHQKILIENEITLLNQTLEGSTTTEEKIHAIENFSSKCHLLLEKNNHTALKAVLTLAAAAIIAVISGSLVLGLGFATGNIMLGAISSGIIGITMAYATTVVAHFCFFRPSSAETALDKFVSSKVSLTYLNE